MKILDVGTWYELFGLNCQKEKIYRYLWVVFLILWTLLGLGRDTHTHTHSLSLSLNAKILCFEVATLQIEVHARACASPCLVN